VNGAHLTLRLGGKRLRADVYWPRATTAGSALVLADELAPNDPLVSEHVVVALSGRRRATDELGALGWLAEHGAELGAEADRLIVAGGAGAARLAVAVRDAGWPMLRGQVLVHPRFGAERPMPTAVADVAPATVVHGGDGRDDGARYAALLRDAGVSVEEVRR
jgi:acetyl esterase/lipase